ncbi:MAG: hypothetical protein IPJ86_17790 [Bacteroidetes bacterium]|nr:hypothetical protein [Bacteroidota bacterium]
MKKIRLLLMILLLITLYHSGYTQCTGGTSGGAITPGLAWQSVNTVGINGGTYRTFNATAGQTFYFSFCGWTVGAPLTIRRFRFWIMQVFL